jgi:hypothetical protein
MQTALNEQSREIERLSSVTISLQEKEKEQTEYIAKLEEMLPKSAKKKLGITQEQNIEETIQEESVDNENVKTLSSGGSF